MKDGNPRSPSLHQLLYSTVTLWFLTGCNSPAPLPKAEVTEVPRVAQSLSSKTNSIPDSVRLKDGPMGAYNWEVANKIRASWYRLMEGKSSITRGQVEVEFTLNADGAVSDVKIKQSDLPSEWGALAVQAIEIGAPYAAWPKLIRQSIGSDQKLITFTFFQN